MLKKSTSILLICLVFFTASSPIRLNAQIRTNQTAQNEATETNPAATDLRKVITDSMNESPTRLDSKEMERESFNAGKRAKLSKGQKTGLYIGIAAAVVAAVVIIVVARRGNDNDNCGVVCLAVGICPPPPPCNQ